MVEPSQFRILDELFDQTQRRVDRFLTDLFLDSVSDQGLMKAIRYASLDGGKRIRPLLVYASATAVGAQLENADAPASAVELIHSYSLVHDDLPAMDDDDLRRGKPSVHKAFNEATAILVGDALQSLAFQSLSEANSNLSAQTKLTMIETLSKAAGTEGMTGGQAMDLDAENRSITLDALEDIHQLKTGALIKASVRLGALCNPDTTTNQFKSLNEFANNIGLAFQIQDDILDEISNTETLGKPQGSDRDQSKTTYVSLLGVDKAQIKADELSNNAITLLEGFSSSADALREMAGFIVKRIH
tara:strand:- start:31 stop:936 length:906 start_codon:yes stop_codon:yes gene_type:complete